MWIRILSWQNFYQQFDELYPFHVQSFYLYGATYRQSSVILSRNVFQPFVLFHGISQWQVDSCTRSPNQQWFLNNLHLFDLYPSENRNWEQKNVNLEMRLMSRISKQLVLEDSDVASSWHLVKAQKDDSSSSAWPGRILRKVWLWISVRDNCYTVVIKKPASSRNKIRIFLGHRWRPKP